MKMKPFPKFLLILFVVFFGFLGIRYAMNSGAIDRIMPRAVKQPSMTPPKASLPELPFDSVDNVNVKSVTLQKPIVNGSSPEVRFEVWAWNAQMALILANEGSITTNGSLMQKYGVNLKINRQDDTNQMQNNLIVFAKELASGNAQPKNGTHFIVIMGDQTAAFFQAINPQLEKLCADCVAQVVGVLGRSNGEDKFMGLPEWKENPQSARGSLVAGVVKEGDWNIVLKWASDNSIANNPDVTTYDPDAINWVHTSTYVEAADKYVAGYCETRDVVRQGKRTGEKKQVCVNGVATWTPEDVKVAMNKGGLISIVSTKSREYRSQMPAVVIGIKKWMRENKPVVEGILAASFEAADKIKKDPASLKRGAEFSAAVYKEKDATYWMKYFVGTTEIDKQGLPVELGGSAVSNLADNIQWFGLAPGTSNLYGATYKIFGDIVIQQYPNDVPEYPPLEKVLDASYVKSIMAKTSIMVKADIPTYSAKDEVKGVVSRKAWHINFETGKATFTSEARQQMDELFNQLVITGLTVEVHGHTDNVGAPSINLALSKRRALAVKQYLEQKSSVNFPEGRIRIKAFGQEKPMVSNAAENGRSQNRRVEIILGVTEG
jgi:OmpA-OmpF porin, OOP family